MGFEQAPQAPDQCGISAQVGFFGGASRIVPRDLERGIGLESLAGPLLVGNNEVRCPGRFRPFENNRFLRDEAVPRPFRNPQVASGDLTQNLVGQGVQLYGVLDSSSFSPGGNIAHEPLELGTGHRSWSRGRSPG
jgi:hypothetical protein